MNGKLLVVEDDEHVRDAVTRALRFEGYEVHTAADGNEGLVRAIDVAPDAILLDVLMPGTDTRSAAARLLVLAVVTLFAGLTAIRVTDLVRLRPVAATPAGPRRDLPVRR